jgi:hypothetical protein
VFECNPQSIWARVYSCNRPDIQPKDVRAILREYERVKLLYRWQDPDGRWWGYWTGIEKPGRLPAPSRIQRKEQFCGPAPPQEGLSKFLDSVSTEYVRNTCIGSGSGSGSGSGKNISSQPSGCSKSVSDPPQHSSSDSAEPKPQQISPDDEKKKQEHVKKPRADPRFPLIVEHYCQLYEKEHKEKADVGGRNGKPLSGFLQRHPELSLETILARLENAFNSTSGWPLEKRFQLWEFLRSHEKYADGPRHRKSSGQSDGKGNGQFGGLHSPRPVGAADPRRQLSPQSEGIYEKFQGVAR